MKNVVDLEAKNVRILFCDIDDTLTTEGKLPAESYGSLWELSNAGVWVVPITGRPAGWCDMIARFWPVAGVIGENGAFYFTYQNKKMKRVWAYEDTKRLVFQQKLDGIRKEVLDTVPGAAVSADQFSRLFDLAIDFCEDVAPLPSPQIQKIVDVFKKYGAQAKVSSIHVNGWFGDHDKLSMCRTYCKNELHIDIDQDQETLAFIGDSPNDEPMFGFFTNSVGVANIKNFLKDLKNPPKYICQKESGEGFVQLATHILSQRK